MGRLLWAFLACGVVGCWGSALLCAGELEEALFRVRAARGFLVVALVSDDPAEAAWVKDVFRSPEWSTSIRPHACRIAPADEHPALVSRLEAATFPQFVLLDGDGREVGRLAGRRPLEELAATFERLVKAAEHCRERESRDCARPLDSETLFWAGNYSWNRGDRLYAVECFEKVMATAEDRRISAAASGHLAQHHLDCGRYAAAEEKFKEALGAGAEDHSGRLALGLSLSLRRQGRIEEAALAIERWGEGRPASQLGATALFALGYLRNEMGDRTTALKYFAACANRFPGTVQGERARRYLGETPGPAATAPPAAGAAPRPAEPVAATGR